MARLGRGGIVGPLFGRPVAGAGSPTRVVAVAAALVLAAVVQSSLSAGFRVIGVIPDLALVFLVTWAAVARPPRIMLWGFGTGFVVDVLGGAPMGTSMLALTAAAYIASLGGSGMFRTNLIWASIAAGVGTVIYYVVSLVMLATHGYAIDWLNAVGATAPAALVVNMAATVALYAPISALERATRARRHYRLS